LAAADLGGEILQKQRIHRPLEPDMQFADLALAQGDDADASKAQLLEEGSNVLLVARQAIQCLSNDDCELSVSSVLKDLLVSGTQMTRAADRAVGVGCDKLPSFAPNALFTDADLILD